MESFSNIDTCFWPRTVIHFLLYGRVPPLRTIVGNGRDTFSLSIMPYIHNCASASTSLSSLSYDQMEEFKIAFELFDKDGDGCVTAKELGAVMRAIGLDPSEEELTNLVMRIDDDGKLAGVEPGRAGHIAYVLVR